MLVFLTLAAAALGASSVVAQTSTSNLTGGVNANSTGGVNASSLPPCALTCALSSLSNSSCAAANVTCVCTNTAYQLQFYNCQKTTCNATEFQVASAFGAKICAANGTPINISVVPSGAQPPASTTAAGSSQNGTATPAKTATAVPTSAGAAPTTKASEAGSLVVQTLGGLLTLAAGVTMLL